MNGRRVRITNVTPAIAITLITNCFLAALAFAAFILASLIFLRSLINGVLR